ncbi:hypothetical protein SUGI_0973620 [Cryptomeria japonica]|nr:hypothetical protein SUGI_0973620 [Cryptomeria japonica]
MASSTPKMGISFKVDDVQELAKLKREDVPERYIRPQQERIGCTALSAPPALDIANILSPHHSTRQHEMDRLAQAYKQWGVFRFVLTNGEYKSVERREVTNRDKEKVFILQLIEEDHPRRYKNYLSNKLEGKRSLDFGTI